MTCALLDFNCGPEVPGPVLIHRDTVLIMVICIEFGFNFS